MKRMGYLFVAIIFSQVLHAQEKPWWQSARDAAMPYFKQAGESVARYAREAAVQLPDSPLKEKIVHYVGSSAKAKFAAIAPVIQPEPTGLKTSLFSLCSSKAFTYPVIIAGLAGLSYFSYKCLMPYNPFSLRGIQEGIKNLIGGAVDLDTLFKGSAEEALVAHAPEKSAAEELRNEPIDEAAVRSQLSRTASLRGGLLQELTAGTRSSQAQSLSASQSHRFIENLNRITVPQIRPRNESVAQRMERRLSRYDSTLFAGMGSQSGRRAAMGQAIIELGQQALRRSRSGVMPPNAWFARYLNDAYAGTLQELTEVQRKNLHNKAETFDQVLALLAQARELDTIIEANATIYDELIAYQEEHELEFLGEYAKSYQAGDAFDSNPTIIAAKKALLACAENPEDNEKFNEFEHAVAQINRQPELAREFKRRTDDFMKNKLSEAFAGDDTKQRLIFSDDRYKELYDRIQALTWPILFGAPKKRLPLRIR